MNYNNSINSYNYTNNNPVNGSSTESLTGNTVSNLKVGQVFEGAINSVDSNGRVVIGLANGQTMSARLDTGVSITNGQSLFFEVKSNDGSLIQIRPVSYDISTNPALIKALDNASVMATEKSVAMVNSMMSNSMSIDANSIATMNRILLSNPDIDTDTAILMTKYDLPVTKENALMFQNYINDSVSIMNDLENLEEGLSNLNHNENISADIRHELDLKILNFFDNQPAENTNVLDNKLATNNEIASNTEIINQNTDKEVSDKVSIVNKDFVLNEDTANTSNLIHSVNKNDSITIIGNGAQEPLTAFKAEFEQLAKESMDFAKVFKDFESKIENGDSNVYNKLLQTVSKEFSLGHISSQSLNKFFDSTLFNSSLKEALNELFTLKPEDSINAKELKNLYLRISKYAGALEEITKSLPDTKDSELVKSSVTNLRDNISFMNSSNDLYTFVQIPLKMFDQNTNGSLYVHQNKKDAYEKGDTITAYLHFDMKYLGPTDVFVSLQNRNVSCKWNLANESSLKLIEDNIDILNERLNKKGYNCKMEVTSNDKNLNFINEFLNQSTTKTTSSNGMMHRYSFDMRA